MQLGQAQVVRSAWYDRGILSVNERYQGNVAPHGVTVRAEYTVPANRVLLLGAIQASITRRVAAAPVGIIQGYINIFDDVGGLDTIYEAFLLDNVIGVYHAFSLSPNILLTAAQRVSLVTSDTSTGGSCHYNLAMSGTEYDA